MLLVINEDTFTSAPSEATSSAIRLSLLTRELGFMRLVVSPLATEAARRHGLDEGLAAGLDLAQRGWLEGQSLLSRLSRVVALVDDPARHGSINGNTYEVATDRAFALGLFKEPSVVTENIATDGAFLNLLFRLWSRSDDAAIDKMWAVRLDQGGGSTISNYVKRFVERPEPMAIVCDRDSEALPGCGDTVKKCVDEIIAHSLFDCRESAKSGGFSGSSAHFAFEVLDAWSIESLVTPNIALLLMENVMNRREIDIRTELLANDHPTYPTLDDESAARWLSTNFKKYNDGKSVWNSNSIQSFIRWVDENDDNREEAQRAFEKDYEIERFRAAIDRVCETLIAIGIRDRRLM